MRYAKALLAYAKAQGKEKQVYEEVKCLQRSFLRLPRLQRVMANPVLPAAEKVRLLQEAAGGAGVSDELLRFFRLVLAGKRESGLLFMTGAYIDLYHQDRHIQVGRLVTAVPAGRLAQQLEQAVAQHTQGAVELETEVDPSLLGGFVLQVGDRRWDASVAHQLKKIQQQFIEKNRRIV